MRICGPSAVVSEPVPHIFVGQDIVERKGDVLALEEIDKSLSEATFRGGGCSFDEDNYL